MQHLNIQALSLFMFKQISKLLSGSAIGQLVGFVLLPVLTHLYSPEVLGEYQMVFSAAMLLAILLTYKLEIAIPTLKAEKIASFIVAVSKLLVFKFLIFALLLLFVLNYTDWLPSEFQKSELVIFALLMGLLIALNNIARFYLIEKNKFGVISITLFLQSGGRSVFQWATHSLSNIGIFAGDVVARGLMLVAVCKSGRPSFRDYSGSITQALKEHWRYPVWVVPSTIMNNSIAILLIPIVATKFGIVEAGVLSVAYRVLSAPNSLLGAALADVLFAKLSSLHKSEKHLEIRSLYVKTAIALVLVSVLGFTTLYWLADLAVYILAEAYFPAIEYLKIMLPWFACQLMISPLSRCIYIYQKQVYKLVFDLSITATLVWVISYQNFGGIEQMLQQLTIVMSSLYLLYFIAVTMMVVRQK